VDLPRKPWVTRGPVEKVTEFNKRAWFGECFVQERVCSSLHRFPGPQGCRAHEQIALHRQIGDLLAQTVDLVAQVPAQRILDTLGALIRPRRVAVRFLVQARLASYLRYNRGCGAVRIRVASPGCAGLALRWVAPLPRVAAQPPPAAPPPPAAAAIRLPGSVPP
jgi:hypothetical protein